MTDQAWSWTITVDDAGSRLDRFVARALDTPRNQIQRLIGEGRVRVGGRHAKASSMLRDGDIVEAEIPTLRDPEIEPEEGEIEILFEDPHLVVVDKPSGIAVHPGAGREAGTLVHRLLARYPEIGQVGGPGRPGIVHRLDIDTSGTLVVARSEAAMRALSSAFADRRVQKRYSAIVYGSPDPSTRHIDQPVGRHPRDRTKMTIRGDGRNARSSFDCLAAEAGIAWLAVAIETGRTHQIRVHLKAVRHPIVGDPKYGEALWQTAPPHARKQLKSFPRPALHARSLGFAHPETGEALTFTAPIPDDMAELWRGVTKTPAPE